jgi:hypothetical protein
MRRPIRTQKSRPIIEIECTIRMPRQSSVEPGRQRVSLVMVEIEPAHRRWTEVRQAPCDRPKPFRLLVRIHKVSVVAIQHQRRANIRFPAGDACRLNRQRKENIRIPDDVVIKVILGPSSEIREIARSSLERNCEANFILLVALSVKRQKSYPLLSRKLQQRSRQGIQRRRLIEPRIRTTHHPVQARDADRRTHPWIGCILIDETAEPFPQG